MIATVRFPEIYYSSNPVRTIIIAVKLPKFRPWLRVINRDIQHLIIHGIDNKINIANAPQVEIPNPPLQPVNLAQLATIFYLYAFGTVLALVSFAVEKVGKRGCCRNSKEPVE